MIFFIAALTLLQGLSGSYSEAAALRARSFFRSPQSLFPSGQANPLDLEKKKIRDYQEIVLTVSKDNRTYHLSNDLLLRDLDLSFRVANARTSETGVVVGFRGAWAFLVSEKTAKQVWWPLTEIQPLPDDLGLAVPLASISLRPFPMWKSQPFQTFAPLTRLRIHQFEDHWALVSPLSQPQVKGWVDLGSLVLKHDFASFALPYSGRWTPIRYRQGNALITGDGHRLELKNVQSLVTRPDLGIISSSSDELDGLQLRSYVLVNSWEFIAWTVSRVPGHGDVFWKSQSVESHPSAEKSENLLNFDEILKRPIYSVAFDPKNPRSGVISAEGVFVTDDGLTWRPIPQFHSDNLPVAMTGDRQIFVGAYRSTDGGKTFLPYLKWEQVTALIEGKSKRASRVLRLVRILPLPNQKVQIEIDNGVRVSKFEGSAKYGLVLHWDHVTNENL